MAHSFLLLCVAYLGSVLATVENLDELTFAAVRHAGDGVHTLTMETAPFGNFGFNSRGFNGSIPGPTFRMNPGDTLEITLVNNLENANNLACAIGLSFCETAITNLHTHGLHVSAKGREDGLAYFADDVMAEVEPGSSESFKFEIPDYHMPGTHWYHPHHHHATALQAGGGAAGVLIVNDPPGYLPEPYASMPERVLMLSGHNLQTLQDMAQSSSSDLFEDAVATATSNGFPTNVFLVNGMLGPSMTMDANTWHRFRMVYAAVEQSLQLMVTDQTDGGSCTFQLLAKDGIYLHSFPRAVETMYMFPGARSDVAVSCSCTVYPCNVTIGSGDNRRLRRRLQKKPPPGDGGAPPNGAGGDMATVDMLVLNIVESSNSAAEDLPITSVQRPCYVVDLREEVVPNARTGSLQLNGGARAVRWNNDQNDLSMTYANVASQAGGDKYSWPAITSFEVGHVYEMTVTGAGAHPFHQHINPYQIVTLPGGPYGDGYFQVGDWHDTLLIDGLDDVTVRVQTDVFTGKQVLHCHILEHEDEGMMGYIELTGTEGTIWTGAENIDPTCLRSAFVAANTSSSHSTSTSGATSVSSTSSSSMPPADLTVSSTSSSSPSAGTVSSSSSSMRTQSTVSSAMMTGSTSSSSASIVSISTSRSSASSTSSSGTTPTSASTASTVSSASSAGTTTATSATDTVAGLLTVILESGSAQDFVDDFNNNAGGETEAALTNGIASGIDGVEAEDVDITDVQLANSSRRLGLRSLQSAQGVAVSYEITVPTELVAEDVVTLLETAAAATAISESLNTELTSFSIQQVEVTAEVVTTTTLTSSVTDASRDPSHAAGWTRQLLVPVLSLLSVGLFRGCCCF